MFSPTGAGAWGLKNAWNVSFFGGRKRKALKIGGCSLCVQLLPISCSISAIWTNPTRLDSYRLGKQQNTWAFWSRPFFKEIRIWPQPISSQLWRALSEKGQLDKGKGGDWRPSRCGIIRGAAAGVSCARFDIGTILFSHPSLLSSFILPFWLASPKSHKASSVGTKKPFLFFISTFCPVLFTL